MGKIGANLPAAEQGRIYWGQLPWAPLSELPPFPRLKKKKKSLEICEMLEKIIGDQGDPHNILRKIYIYLFTDFFFFSLEVVMTDDVKGAVNGIKLR